MDTIKVGVFAGSLRKKAFSKAVANYLMEILPDWMEPELLDIGKLPLYCQDYDEEGLVPEEYVLFRNIVREKQAFLFVTPEYNRSVPAALKNALDVGSRPYGQSVWAAKPGAIVSVSPSAIGGFGANHHLRQPMVFLDIYLMQQPECYLGNIESALEDGVVTSERTQKFLANYASHFSKWVKRFVN